MEEPKKERLTKILEYIKTIHTVTIQQLAKDFHMSKMTIKRCFHKLY